MSSLIRRMGIFSDKHIHHNRCQEFSLYSKPENSPNQHDCPQQSSNNSKLGTPRMPSLSETVAFYEAQKKEKFKNLPKHVKKAIRHQRNEDIKQEAINRQILEKERKETEISEKSKTIADQLGVNLLDLQADLDLSKKTLQSVRAELASIKSSKTKELVCQKLTYEIEELKRGLQRHVNIPLSIDFSIACKRFRPREYITNNSRPFDSKLLELLSQPRPNILSHLANLLFTTPFQPTAKSYNIMIRRLTILRLNSAAWLVFHAMLLTGLRPDPYTISSLLRLTAVTNDYIGFRQIVRLMRVPGIKQPRNLVVYGALIDGCVKFGKVRFAAMYYRSLKRDNLIPDLEINTSILQLCDRMKLWEQGVWIWKEMQSSYIDERGYLSMYRLCQSCRKSSESQTVVLQAQKHGFFMERIGDLRNKTKGLHVHPSNKLPCFEDLAINKMPKLKDNADNPQYRSALKNIWSQS